MSEKRENNSSWPEIRASLMLPELGGPLISRRQTPEQAPVNFCGALCASRWDKFSLRHLAKSGERMFLTQGANFLSRFFIRVNPSVLSIKRRSSGHECLIMPGNNFEGFGFDWC